MLEIKSDWQSMTDESGNVKSFFTIYMKRDKEWFNCARAGEMLSDPDQALETIKCVIHNLIFSCYEELRDPLYKAKKQLIALESQIEVTKQYIKTLEDAREKSNAAT